MVDDYGHFVIQSLNIDKSKVTSNLPCAVTSPSFRELLCGVVLHITNMSLVNVVIFETDFKMIYLTSELFDYLAPPTICMLVQAVDY